jgi:hypothetical protein
MTARGPVPPDRGSPRRPERLLDDRLLCSLLLHPEVTAEQARARAAHRRSVRAGLTVAALSGVVLAPAVSFADDSASPAPIVTASCQITAALADGTPSGLLADGTVCVQPVADPAPEAPPPPAPTPPSTPEPAPDPPTAAEPAPAPELPAAADPAAAPSAAAEATPEPPRAAAPVVTPRPAPEPHRAGGRHTDRPAQSRRHHPRQAPAPAPVPATPAALPGVLSQPLATPFFVTDAPVIPRFLVGLYKQAGRRYHVPWPILAAINEIETDFGRNVAVSPAGATGWMQFMPGTWRTYGVDADHDGVKNPDDPRDAIFAAARYLKASGAKHDMRRAIFAYNHAGWYVDSILLRAERIAAHQGEHDRRLERLFVAGQRRLERQVLTDPRITIYDCGRQDIAAHRVDRRVLIVLGFLAWSGLSPTVTSLECGHGEYTSSGNVSEHASGSAVDIAAINGVPILGNQGPGSVTEATISELLTLRGALAPHQIISLMSFAGSDNTLAMGDHADHIHVGFRPLAQLTR